MSKPPLVDLGTVYFTRCSLREYIQRTQSNNPKNSSTLRDAVDLNNYQPYPVTYNNLVVNSINQKFFAEIVLEASQVSDEIKTIKNNNLNKNDMDTKIKELENTLAKLIDLARNNVNNAKAALVTYRELALIENIIENSNTSNEIRYYALWSILNGVIHHNNLIIKSTLNLIITTLEDKNANEKLKKDCLIGFAHAAKNGQLFETSVLDKIGKFLDSNFNDQVISVFYHTEDASKFSKSVMNKIRNQRNSMIVFQLKYRKLNQIIENYNQATHINNSQSSLVEDTNSVINSSDQKSPAQIILAAVKILGESHNIKNNYSGNKSEIDAKINELEKTFSELMASAKKNMMNPKARFAAKELPLINGIIENQNLVYTIRLCAMSLIYNGVAYHKKQLEESSLDAIVKVLKEDKINSRKTQEYCLILLAKSAEKGQVLEDNILDEVSKFVNSNLADKAILVFNQAKDHSNISDRIIDELKKIARNLNMTGNSKKNEKLQNLVAEIIEYDRNKKIQVSIDNIEKIIQYGLSGQNVSSKEDFINAYNSTKIYYQNN